MYFFLTFKSDILVTWKKLLGRYGEKLPDYVPGTHCGYNALQDIVHGLSMNYSLLLLNRLHDRCRKLTDGKNIANLEDPATLKSDGFSSGVKGMELYLLKIYESPTS